MPLRSGKSREVVSSNIREMVAAGHPANQSVAAALRKADEYGQGKKKAPRKRRAVSLKRMAE